MCPGLARRLAEELRVLWLSGLQGLVDPSFNLLVRGSWENLGKEVPPHLFLAVAHDLGHRAVHLLDPGLVVVDREGCGVLVEHPLHQSIVLGGTPVSRPTTCHQHEPVRARPGPQREQAHASGQSPAVTVSHRGSVGGDQIGQGSADDLLGRVPPQRRRAEAPVGHPSGRVRDHDRFRRPGLVARRGWGSRPGRSLCFIVVYALSSPMTGYDHDAPHDGGQQGVGLSRSHR